MLTALGAYSELVKEAINKNKVTFYDISYKSKIMNYSPNLSRNLVPEKEIDYTVPWWEKEIIKTPVEIIISKSKKRKNGYFANVDFIIRGSALGKDGSLYINSERNYKSPKSLNINISADIVAELMDTYDFSCPREIIGKSVSVNGLAKQVKIGNKDKSKYYYQTQVRVTDIDQIKIIY